ncbi:MAG: DNA repair protein RecO C-terminal domain-containing protein [Pseudomonadaceae bacterium]|nr:DNA repair protein RecO C-terminal domain-containing protein [Pseudomonadaceae bacterium]
MATRDGEALLLGVRPLGEQGVMATLFSREYGTVRGLLRSGKGMLAGDTVRFSHARRLENQLGKLRCEVAVSRAALLMNDTTAAYVAAYLAELTRALLPEDHPYEAVYEAFFAVWQGHLPWWRRLAELERSVLAAVGYGLSLADDAVPCAAGAELCYVSPNSGRAVSRATGAPYVAKLLELPAIWGGVPCSEAEDALRALRLTGSFLGKSLHGKELTARTRLVEHLLGGLQSQGENDAQGSMDDGGFGKRFGGGSAG